MTTPEVGCRELVELLTDYLDDAVAPDLRRTIDAHLDECPGCRAALDNLSETVSTLRQTEVEQLPQPLIDQLLAAFADHTS